MEIRWRYRRLSGLRDARVKLQLVGRCPCPMEPWQAECEVCHGEPDVFMALVPRHSRRLEIFLDAYVSDWFYDRMNSPTDPWALDSNAWKS